MYNINKDTYIIQLHRWHILFINQYLNFKCSSNSSKSRKFEINLYLVEIVLNVQFIYLRLNNIIQD